MFFEHPRQLKPGYHITLCTVTKGRNLEQRSSLGPELKAPTPAPTASKQEALNQASGRHRSCTRLLTRAASEGGMRSQAAKQHPVSPREDPTFPPATCYSEPCAATYSWVKGERTLLRYVTAGEKI